MNKEHTAMGKVILRSVGIIIFIPIAVLSLLFISMFLLATKPIEDYYYESTDLSDYGDYIGNGDNSFPQEFINSFFPEQIQDNFSNVVYSYRAENFDTYGFEAYLEFEIKNREDFVQYITAIGGESDWQTFLFDDSYMEYVISNELSLHPRDSGEQYNHIESAEIGKILYSIEEQRIIYVAIGVFDGGGITTEYLCKFFNRFNIDPLDYEQSVG